MNKELEEVISTFEFYSNLNVESGIGLSRKNTKKLQEIMKKALSYIENSIPKKVIEEKIDDIDKALDEEYEKSVAYMQLTYARIKLQELLEVE